MTRTKKFKPMKVPFHKDCLACRKCIACPIQWDAHMQSNRHARDLKRYHLKIGIPHVEVHKDRVSIDFDGDKKVKSGEEMELEVDIKKDVIYVPVEMKVESHEDMKLVDNEFSEEMADEVLSDDELIIKSFMAKGISIPTSISKVCKVQKQNGYIKTSDYLEINENCILVSGNELLGLVIFDFFGLTTSQSLAISLYNLCKTSGFVRRSPKIKMNYQFMHGARICNGEFDRYKQSLKVRGGGCLPGKKPPSPTDLDYIASNISNSIYSHLKIHLSSWTEEWEKMVPNDVDTTIARLGTTPFTTMGSTLNFHVSAHCDDTDSGFGVITWFDRFFNQNTCNRSQFRLVEYGVFLHPKQGTLMVFKIAEIKHQTVQNHGYAQLGLALAIKEKVLEAGQRHLEEIGFGPIVDEEGSKFSKTYERRLK